MEPKPNNTASQMAEEALNQLSVELEAGRSEALKNYLSAMSRFHRYSWGNVLLIASQRPTATRVAGYHAWQQVGRSVKKGEKGLMIFAPMVVKQEPATDKADTKEPLRLAGFRTVYVFDVAQTEGRPLPDFAQTAGDPREYRDRLQALIGEQDITVQYDAGIAPAQGVSSGGQIRLLPDLAPAEEFSVLTHELAHEMLHHDKSSAPLSRLVQETQAEAVAFVVCRVVGLETNHAAADYIALYNGDQKTLAQSLSVIQQTSARILDRLLAPERSTALPAKTPVERKAAGAGGSDAERSGPDSGPEPSSVPGR
jgi:antirestriction protein ArdC